MVKRGKEEIFTVPGGKNIIFFFKLGGGEISNIVIMNTPGCIIEKLIHRSKPRKQIEGTHSLNIQG